MVASLKKSSWVDPSKRARGILDYVLDGSSEEVMTEKEAQAPVSKELSAKPFVQFNSSRVRSRILFITKDASVLEEDSILLQHFKSLTDTFNEIHIVLLSSIFKEKKDPKRFEKNMWVYCVYTQGLWSLSNAILKIAKQQLEFTDGFRPDVIVSLDPFESGIAGVALAEKYDRPFQVHVLDDFLTDTFLEEDEKNKKRLKWAQYVLSRTQSVRVSTENLRTKITKKFPKIEDVGLLPRHYDIQAILDAVDTNSLQNTFPQYAFIILFVGDLDSESTLYRAIDASRSILTSSKIGLVVLGEGSARTEFEKRAEILGISNQVVFNADKSNLIPYLKSADLLLCTDTTQKSDEIVVKAAAAGLPLLVARTSMREDLFVDGESAFLCDPEDTIDFSHKLSKFLNQNSLRKQFSQNAREIIKTRLHEDPEIYKASYRDSIEVVFGGGDREQTNE